MRELAFPCQQYDFCFTYQSEEAKAGNDSSCESFESRLGLEHHDRCLKRAIKAHQIVECIVDSNAANSINEPYSTLPETQQKS